LPAPPDRRTCTSIESAVPSAAGALAIESSRWSPGARCRRTYWPAAKAKRPPSAGARRRMRISRPSSSIARTRKLRVSGGGWVIGATAGRRHAVAGARPLYRKTDDRVRRMGDSNQEPLTDMPAPIAPISDAERYLREAMQKRIVILDGAMGTMIQQFKLAETDFRGERFADHPTDLRGDNELLPITRPEVSRSIHEQYLEAGADILETNTFGATSIAQADYGLQVFAAEMNLASARLAREAADRFATPGRPRFVAGALGPQPKTASISPDVNDPGARNVTFDELA